MLLPRHAIPAAVLAVVALLVLAPGSAMAGHDYVPDANPCLTSSAQRLYCPDLIMSAPSDLRLERTVNGRLLFRAKNSLNSRGRGPAELRGIRIGPYTMAARQAVHRVGGGVRMLDTGAHLGFKFIPGQGRYWKFRHAAEFELWRLDAQGRKTELVRGGPKVYYCLRDLRRTKRMKRSPSRAVYPRCSQDKNARRVTLGTSVGWSDIYPASYHEQWIDVTGLSGRFAYVHIADPQNGMYESNETNNVAETIVELPSGRVIARHGPSSTDPPPDY